MFHRNYAIARMVAFLVAMIICVVNIAYGQDVLLDFTKQPTLKSIFDAGLRPYRRPNLEFLQVRAEFPTAKVIFPDEISIDFQNWQWIDFSVINDGRLSTVELRTGPLTVEDATKIMSPFVTAKSGSLKEMENFLKQAQEQPFFYKGEYHVGSGKTNPAWIVAFRRAGGSHETPVAVEISMDWQFPKKSDRLAYYKVPIPPPPGYENISMDPPPRDLNQKPFPDPAYSSDKMRKQTEAMKAAKDQTVPSLSATPTPSIPQTSSAVQINSDKASVPWLWIISGILFLVVAGGVLFITRRK